jgi:hypothetical protein
MRHRFPIMFLCSMIAACGDKSDDAGSGDEWAGGELECGDGTHEEDGACVPDEDNNSDAGGGDEEEDAGGGDEEEEADDGDDDTDDSDDDADDGGSDPTDDTGAPADGADGGDDGSTDGHDTADDAGADTGDPDSASEVDSDGDGFTPGDGDCDDTSPLVHPTAVDLVGDEIDMDCDGIDGTDSDSDGYAAVTTGGDDCNDEDATINPEAVEAVCDGIDNDCDGEIDIGTECISGVRINDEHTCASFGHSYVFVGSGLTWIPGYGVEGGDPRTSWDSARTSCLDIGYDLAIIEDSCEWDWMAAQMIDGALDDQWWLGLRSSDDGYRWVDGSEGYVGYWSPPSDPTACVRFTPFWAYPDVLQLGAFPDHGCGENLMYVCETL